MERGDHPDALLALSLVPATAQTPPNCRQNTPPQSYLFSWSIPAGLNSSTSSKVRKPSALYSCSSAILAQSRASACKDGWCGFGVGGMAWAVESMRRPGRVYTAQELAAIHRAGLRAAASCPAQRHSARPPLHPAPHPPACRRPAPRTLPGAGDAKARVADNGALCGATPFDPAPAGRGPSLWGQQDALAVGVGADTDDINGP